MSTIHHDSISVLRRHLRTPARLRVVYQRPCREMGWRVAPMDERQPDPTALSYWFPRIEAAGIPVPRTMLVETPRCAMEAVWAAFDGKEDGDIKPLVQAIAQAAASIGYPTFL